MIHAPDGPELGGGTAPGAYAFSIDDKLSFKHVMEDRLIITIAGAKGLELDRKTPQPTPVPTPIRTAAKEIRGSLQAQLTLQDGTLAADVIPLPAVHNTYRSRPVPRCGTKSPCVGRRSSSSIQPV